MHSSTADSSWTRLRRDIECPPSEVRRQSTGQVMTLRMFKGPHNARDTEHHQVYNLTEQVMGNDASLHLYMAKIQSLTLPVRHSFRFCKRRIVAANDVGVAGPSIHIRCGCYNASEHHTKF